MATAACDTAACHDDAPENAAGDDCDNGERHVGDDGADGARCSRTS